MKTNHRLLELLLQYKQVLYIVTGIGVIAGMIALILMPRDEYPEFKIRQGIIVAVFPGASSQQVEEQVTSKIEKYLFQYKSVDRSKTYSVSKENVMVIYVEVSKTEKDPDAFWAKLRHGLNEIKNELPAGVMSLTADNDFGNTSALLLAVQSDTKSYKELEDYVKQFEDNVRKVPSVSRVKHYGLQKEQISVYIDDAKLTRYGIKPLLVLAALKPQNAVVYAGDIDDGKHCSPIHIPLSLTTEQDVANQIVYSDPTGNVIRLKDVARVVREYDVPDSYVRVNGKKCLIVSLEMQTGNNIVRFGSDVGAVIDKFSGSLPEDIKIITISNIPDAVSRAITGFMKEFGMAIVSVILVTILLLPRRVALVAAATIPIAILITLGVMWIVGMDLQTVSLAGLIIVLGMVVDNAIVIIDNYVEKLDNNIPPRDAATQSVTDLFGSVFSATLIIISCFMPLLLFMTGLSGDFVHSLPMTITLALFISLFISVTLVPILSYTFIKTGIKSDANTGKKAAILTGMQKMYDRLLEDGFRHKKHVIAIGVGSFVAGLILLAVTPKQPFPTIERNQFAVEVYLPEGSSLQQTDAVLKDLECVLARDNRVKVVTSFVGTGSPRFHAIYAPQFPGKNYGQLVVLTESNDATVELLDEYSTSYANRYPSAEIKWKQLEMTKTTAPIEVRISGDSIAAIKRVADQVMDLARPIPGTAWIRTDYRQPIQSVELDMKKDEAARMGFSNTVLGYSLLTGTKGFPVTTVWEGDYPIDVKLKVDKKVKSTVADIGDQYVTSPFLVSSIPVRQLATLRPGWTEGQIVRRNGTRTITVSINVVRGVFPSTIFARLQPQIERLSLPDGMSIEYGGEYEDNAESMTPFYYSLVVSIVIIFLILMAQFRTMKTAVLIMMTMPLSLFGAALGVFITGYPFGVTAFIGLIGLMGIVVRNGIIYISYAEELRREHGHTLEEAALSAAKRRMRPIFLTSAAAAVGVVPMILSGSTLWGPLGTVICFGLLFGLVLSLLVMPVLYYVFHRNDFQNVEEVEPA